MIKELTELRFIGKNSLGYENGKTYKLVIGDKHSLLNPKFSDCPIVIERVGGGGLCPYTSLETFMDNWTTQNIPSHDEIKVQVEAYTKKIDLFEAYEKEMQQEYRFHEIPHHAVKIGYSVNWYPVRLGETVEYELTVSNEDGVIRGTFEAWKRGKGLL